MFLSTKKITAICLALLSAFQSFASGSQSVTMTVGESKTLYLPTSVTSLYLKSCNFVAYSPDYADIKSQSTYSVTVVANKCTSTPVIIRCNYTYYVLSAGRYIYGGIGAYDFKITVNDIPATSISLPETESLEVGKSKTLIPTITPSNATSALTWSSSNYSNINIDKNGTILAQKAGTSVITVTTDNGKSASCTVTAYRPETAVTYVSVTPTTLTLDVGREYTLSSTVHPSDATNKTLIWSSSNTGVATVSSSGKVRAVSVGTATIYATSNNGKKGSCNVTCNEVIPDLTLIDKQDAPSIPAKANLTYNRTFYSGWNSLCVPFAVKSSYIEGCKLAVIKEREIRESYKYFSFTMVDEVPAGIPCLVWVEKDTDCAFQLKEQTLVATPVNNGMMIGSFYNTTIGPGYYKLTSDGSKFSITTGENATVTAFRTYIKLQ